MALSPTEAKEFSEQKLRREYLESQRVIVHIWTSGFNIDRRGGNIGHVAITHPSERRSEYFYLSLWPTKAGKERGYGITSAIEHEFKPNLQADIDAEKGRPPEFTLCFYTLDVDKIRKAYNEACETTKGWSLHGLAFCGNADSCVSSAWKLLLAGNIRKLISHLEQSSASAAGSSQGASLGRDGSLYASEMIVSPLIKSPDAVTKFLAKAKQRELERESLTRELRFARETPIRDLPQDRWQDKCLDKPLFCYNYLKEHPRATILGLGIAGAGLAWASGYTPELPETISKSISDSCKIM